MLVILASTVIKRHSCYTHSNDSKVTGISRLSLPVGNGTVTNKNDSIQAL